jgi:hypothetical protein
LLVLGIFCGCDALNAPLKEEIDYHLSLHPVKTGEELAAAIGAVPLGGSGAFTIMTDIFLSATIFIGGKTITVEAYAGNGEEKTIRRAAGFFGSMFEVQPGGTLVLGGGRDKERLALDGNSPALTDSLIKVGGGNLALNDGAELRNNHGNSGGGVYVASGSFTMTGGTISGNTADTYGGGVCVSTGSFTMTGGSISGNTVTSSASGTGGGGVYVVSGSFTVTGGSISGNTSSTSGGGVYNQSIFTMSGGTISGNRALGGSGFGGGVCTISSAGFTMSGGSISGNYGGHGGGVSVTSSGVLNMSGGTIGGNTAAVQGGGVYVQDAGCYFRMGGPAVVHPNNPVYLAGTPYPNNAKITVTALLTPPGGITALLTSEATSLTTALVVEYYTYHLTNGDVKKFRYNNSTTELVFIGGSFLREGRIPPPP